LHLCGSKQDEFYNDLSKLYAKACADCQELDHERFSFHFAVIHLDASWSFPESLETSAIEAAERMPIGHAITHIAALHIDVMVPHMFCVEGMTRYRSLFDMIGIPFLGNHEYTIWPATDKATTKQVLEAARVATPKGVLLEKGKMDWPVDTSFPLIVKPCNTDNSHGLSLVRKPQDLPQAVEHAFTFDSRIVVEQYIDGRELRAGVIEEADGTLTVLPFVEYFLEDIRTSAHKLQTDSNGKLADNAIVAAKKDGDRKVPADVTDVLRDRIETTVKRAHLSLNCRHYSLYDLRVDSDENPYILEAALFCSFSPLSVIPVMANHSDRKDLHHPHFFHDLLERTAREGRKNTSAKV
jgi:D-alanine-D-alanine ligase